MSSAISREMLEERIEREKAALAEALADLRDRARAQVNLSNRVRERPSADAAFVRARSPSERANS